MYDRSRQNEVWNHWRRFISSQALLHYYSLIKTNNWISRFRRFNSVVPLLNVYMSLTRFRKQPQNSNPRVNKRNYYWIFRFLRSPCTSKQTTFNNWKPDIQHIQKSFRFHFKPKHQRCKLLVLYTRYPNFILVWKAQNYRGVKVCPPNHSTLRMDFDQMTISLE